MGCIHQVTGRGPCGAICGGARGHPLRNLVPQPQGCIGMGGGPGRGVRSRWAGRRRGSAQRLQRLLSVAAGGGGWETCKSSWENGKSSWENGKSSWFGLRTGTPPPPSDASLPSPRTATCHRKQEATIAFKPPKLHALARPSNLEAVRAVVQEEGAKAMEPTIGPAKGPEEVREMHRNRVEVPVKMTAAAILREQAVYQKREEEELQELSKKEKALHVCGAWHA